ncbi:MAG: hypothetical protein WDO14_18550 [Bacteroidota bacterium]
MESKNNTFFEEFGKKMDQFLVELKDAGKRMDADMQKKYEELKVSAERFKKEAQNKERWKEVEDGLKKAGEEMEKAIKAAFKKREA